MVGPWRPGPDVGLAARCLNCLGRDYRDGRLRGGTPDLQGRIGDIDEGVFRLPRGGDSFQFLGDRRLREIDRDMVAGTVCLTAREARDRRRDAA